MGINSCSSLTEMVIDTWEQVIDAGMKSKPRGLPCRQLVGFQTRLTSPRNRLVLIPERRWSLAYAAGELAWYLAGDDALDFIRYYAPSYHRFSDDGERLHGAYGPRIFKSGAWDLVVNKMKRDPDTRQAVLPIFKLDDLKVSSKDTPCTLSLQFISNLGYLNLIVTMRSNDAWLGLPYDAFCFTVLQELMAMELGIKLGGYTHQVGSMHLYDKDLAAVRTIVPFESTPCLPISETTTTAFIGEMLKRERVLRTCDGEFAVENVEAFLSSVKEPSLLDLMTCAWAWKKALRSLTNLNALKTLRALLERKLDKLMLCFDSIEQKGERR